MQLLYNCTLFEVYFVLKACLQKNTTQPIKKRSLKKKGQPSLTYSLDADFPPVDLYWFFEISIRAEKKFQLELKKNVS